VFPTLKGTVVQRLRAATFLASFLPILAGCQSLVLQPDDSAGVTTGKVVGRTLLGVSTLGLSEIWYARRRALESWLGHHINEVIASWGPPAQVTEGYGGVRFFTWYSVSSYTTPGQAQTHCDAFGNCYSTFSPAQTNQIQHRTTLTVNSAGTVVAYSAQ
jgi:hypothetical protein